MTKFKARPAMIGETDKKLETALYITEIVLELYLLARGAELKALSGMLELAFYEAFSLANKVEVPPAEIERMKALEQAAKDAEQAGRPPRPQEARAGSRVMTVVV